MKNFEIRIEPEDIVTGGMTLWVIEIKERLYNGRVRLLIVLTLTALLLFYIPVISYILLGILLLIIVVDFCITFFKYKRLSALHRNEQASRYFLHLTDEGFSHSLKKEGEAIATNCWKSYDYLIDVKKKGLFILVDKNGGTNFYYNSWMSNEAFANFKDLAYRKIKRKLNDRFV